MNIEELLDKYDPEEILHMLREWELYVEEYIKGLELGKREEKFNIARLLRQMGKDDSFIHQATELSLEEIKSIHTNEG